jgi:hypothetical protein
MPLSCPPMRLWCLAVKEMNKGSLRLGSHYRAGRSKDWVKVKNPGRAGRTSAGRGKLEDNLMSRTKEACQRKRRTNAVPTLGAAGLSLSLASGPAAAIGGVNPDPATSAPIARQVMDEEEIFDVRLATFRVFDGESASTPRTRPTIVGAGACGIGLYYPQNQSVLSEPVYQTPRPFRPRPTRPASKYKR